MEISRRLGPEGSWRRTCIRISSNEPLSEKVIKHSYNETMQCVLASDSVAFILEISVLIALVMFYSAYFNDACWTHNIVLLSDI